MGKITSLIRRAPKRLSAIVAIVTAAVIIPAVVFAWGPNRATFTVKNPAPYVTFNSITDNPNYGDERNFVTIKDAANTNNGGWTDEINVQAGKEYYVRMYVHNNAAENLNLVAENVTAKFNLPSHEAKRIQIDGYLSSSNANPGQVWDQAVFNGANNFSLDYVEGSARYNNNVFTGNGATLSDNVVSNGATLGYDKLDGKIPGCFKYDGFVTFKVKALENNFDVQKTVRKTDSTDKTFKESVAVKPGDKVDYQIYFKNTGNTQLKEVVVKDILPAGVTYVPGTTHLYNSSGNRVVADGIAGGGIIIGGYMPNGDAYMKFTAQVANNDKLPVCGPNTLKNVAKVTTDAGSKEDTANVTVDKECKPEVKYTCDSLAVKKLTSTKVQFTTNYTVENATFKNVTYVIRNASGAEIDRKVSTANTLEYTQTTPGKYTVEAIVTVTVNGQDKTVTGPKCKGEFEIEKKVVVKYTCNALEIKSISRTEFRFSTAYSVENATFKSITYVVRNAAGTVVDTITATTNSTTYTQSQAGAYTVQATVHFTVNGEEKTATSDKCKGEFKVKDLPKEITVCELATKKIVTIKESEFNPSKYSKNLDDCKEAPKTIEVCEIATKKIVTINESDMDSRYTTDLSKCEETPVVPPELPQTGTTENIVAIVGLGAMIASIAYYAASRRALNQ